VLEMPPGSAAFRLEHTFYDFADRPVSWGWFIFRSDLYRLTTHIGADASLR
jgi:GntR family transcriptional regulator